MDQDTHHDVTRMLQRWNHGDGTALDELIPHVYRELRGMAQKYLSRERSGHTLQSTALVHELYERMVQQNLPQFRNRAHFFAIAAQLMRQILVDHARAKKSAKRGGSVPKVTVGGLGNASTSVDLDLVALDDALTQLAKLDAQQCRVVELKVFTGLTNDDTAAALGISLSTVKRDWETGRAWLYRELMST
jgi:RNA polymerase sigma factor (TIGR02999 family)